MAKEGEEGEEGEEVRRARTKASQPAQLTINSSYIYELLPPSTLSALESGGP